MDSRTFGSFYLAKNEFAIPVGQVQEVVNAPADYTKVPLAPIYLKGLFNLRGNIIPVLDLKKLLDPQDDSTHSHLKIAVIELKGACVGLLFDSTGEVFKYRDDEKSDFNSTNNESIISGVFKKDSGKRIVQILDVAKLFKLRNIPETSSRAQHTNLDKRGVRKQSISFRVGPAQCALLISEIQEIIRPEEINCSALSSGHCIGSIDLRGTTVPIINFASLLNYRNTTDERYNEGDQRVIVMKLEKELFGLLVDTVDSIISFFDDEMLKFPMLDQHKAEMFLGCIVTHEKDEVLLLSHQNIFTNKEVEEITKGHSRIYQKNELTHAQFKSKGGSRNTYVTFKIEQSYAVAIHEIKEIINYPQQLLHPPGVKKHISGVLNLRGDLVSIIDARSLYHCESIPAPQTLQKIIVFKKDDLHYGLIVDSVESIVSIAENDKIKLPRILFDQGPNSISSMVIEAVEAVDSAGIKRSLLILSTDLLTQMIAMPNAA